MKEQQRKKILFCITKSVWGGAQRYVYDLASSLPKEKFEVAVAAGSNGELFKKLQALGIRTICIKNLERDISIGKEISSLSELAKIFINEKPDVVHLNSSKMGILGGIASYICFLKTGKKPKTIFTAHGWVFKEDRPFYQRVILFFLSAVSSLLHDQTILISQTDFNSAKKFIPQKKRVLISLGIISPEFLPREKSREFLFSFFPKVQDKNNVLFITIAELTKNKGLKYLIEAMTKLKEEKPEINWNLLIIGEGEEKNKLVNTIKEKGLEDKIYLAGFINEASRFLKGADVFVLPSVKEGLPYVILEAISAQLPIIATKVGGIPNVLNNYLVPPKNVELLKKALADSIKNKYADAINKKQSNSFEEMLDKTITLFEE